MTLHEAVSIVEDLAEPHVGTEQWIEAVEEAASLIDDRELADSVIEYLNCRDLRACGVI